MLNRILFSLATIFEKRAKIKECAQFADKGMAAILNSVYYGASVIEPFALSRSIQNELIQLKQFDPLTTSFLTAVWPAPISAMPHSVPQLNDEMKEGPNVAMTYFRINGYAAECERTFFLSEPTAQEVELFEQMMEARNRALALVRPGVKTADIDAAARDYLESKGLLPTLLHRTGHGVGLGNHEAPFMAIGSDEVLEENMIITIEQAFIARVKVAIVILIRF